MPHARIAGGLIALQGVVLSQFPGLGWTLQASDLCLSLGFSLLLASTVRLAFLDGRMSDWRFLVLTGAIVLVFGVHQMRALTVKGLVRLTDRPIESITVQRAGGAVNHHLGGPLKLVPDLDENGQEQSKLTFGVGAGKLAMLPDECCRSRLGPWFIERLGLDFRDASLSADVSIQHGETEPQRVKIRRGGAWN